ncbi:6813_t:CDS:2, partial [Dentiscutata erythropus]
NLKMNGSKAMLKEIIDRLNPLKFDDCVGEKVAIAPPSIFLDLAQKSVRKGINVAAQNSFNCTKGAYTGEISPEQLKDLGIDWVILGHSERREIFKESDESALAKNWRIENLEKTQDVVIRQLRAIVEKIEDWKNVVIAYEPVWAIGTGKVATPQQAQEVHFIIRDWLTKNVSEKVAQDTRIIYGGSVKGTNSSELAEQLDVDGFLVGGASLTEDFIKIIKCFMPSEN